MSLIRIRAILLQEFYITRHSMESIVDIFYFSIINVVVFGFINLYLTGSVQSVTSQYLLLGMLLWEIVRITQYSISVAALWNVWSRNLSNMFITPLSLKEYILSQMLSGIVKALFVFTIITIIASFLYGFTITKLGMLNLFLFYINLTIFAWIVGIFILGLIFRYGTRIQSLAWSLIFLFQPLSAAFFPVDVLPAFLRPIAYALPPTYVFEAARAALVDSRVDWNMISIAFIMNCIYFCIALWYFSGMYYKSRMTGQFARNES